ncbi:MAG: heme ABC transporter ATP-binding protein [Rhizobiaceae bacterium]|nr:heme ABC transporter ATP-binding protein [Rhizobiaceae bacterium]MCV0408767.1 heme ABC transporter ATP-binding protein [Rhizobiaceae bacterium]
MIATSDLSVFIGRLRIVRGVTFKAQPGEVTAIIGPNGSGKTTLLKALSGDAAYTGSAGIDGIEIASMKPWQAAGLRAVLPQSTSLSFPFTVREIVRLGLTGGSAGPGRSGDRVAEALARVDLEGFAGRFYQELSGGEQQRVQLARVLCQVWDPVVDGRPCWLFLDEPVSSLDIRHQLAVMDVARTYAESGGGVIAVLHDLNLTAMYADEVLVMRKGEMAAFGAPRSVLDDRLLEDVFECRLRVGALPAGGVPFVLPQSAG